MALIALALNTQIRIGSADARIEVKLRTGIDVNVQSTGTLRRTVVVDQSGTPMTDGWLDKAVHGDITWTPSGTATWSITMPAADSKVPVLLSTASASTYGIGEPLREVQLWRGDRVLTWGPAVTPRVSGERLEVSGQDVGFYYDRRTIGPGTRPNLLDNPDLSLGLSGWSVLVTKPPYTFTSQTASANISFAYAWGNKALKVVNTTADDSMSEPMALQFHRYGAYAWSHRWTFSATVWVSDWQRPNPRKSGIGLVVLPVDWTNLYTDARAVAWASIDEQFSREGPQRVSVSVEAGNAVEGFVVPVITGPKGTSYFFDMDLDMEGGLEFSGEDQGTIASKVSDHITGNTSSPYERAIHGLLWPYSGAQEPLKSNVKVGAQTTIDGKPRSRRYFYGSGTTGSSALREFAQLDDGFEYDFAYSATTRTLRTHHPRLGSYKAQFPIRYTLAGGNVVSWSWSFEGGHAANRVTVQGQGSLGYDRYGRDQGARRVSASAPNTWESVAPSTFANGTTLEETRQAPVDVKDWQLAGMATKRLTQTTRPVTLQVRIPAYPYFDQGLWVGDRVPVLIQQASFSLSDTMRITKMTLTGDDWLDLTLSPWDGGQS